MEFLNYRKFNDEASALEFCELLKKHGIESECKKDLVTLDSMYGANELSTYIYVKVRAHDFEKANKILEITSEINLDEVDKEYYLFEFSDEELFDLIRKRDEWSDFDFQLAKKLLVKRGRTLQEKELSALEEERISELSKPDKSYFFWIALGYISAAFGGLFGIILGYVIYTKKKTLPNGQQIYANSESDRKHGSRIFTIGVIVLACVVLLFVFLILSNV